MNDLEALNSRDNQINIQPTAPLTDTEYNERRHTITNERNARTFAEISDRVQELNGLLNQEREAQGGIVDNFDLSSQLFDIVAQLNTQLNLGLNNTWLDIQVVNGNIEINYAGQERVSSTQPMSEIALGEPGTFKIIIHPDMGWQKFVTREGGTSEVIASE